MSRRRHDCPGDDCVICEARISKIEDERRGLYVDDYDGEE